MQFDRQTLISAVTSKSMHYIESPANTAALPYLQYDVVKFFSPKNTVSRILGLAIYWDHCEQVQNTIKSVIISLVEDNAVSQGVPGVVENISIDALDSKDFALVHGEPLNAYKVSPSDLAAFERHLQNMTFDDTRYLQIAFYNNTGYTTTSRRYVKMFVEREVISR